MCGFAVEGVPRKKTRCGLAGESGGGAGSAVEVENDSLTRVNMSRDYWRLLESCSASERACEQGKRAIGRTGVTLFSHTLFSHQHVERNRAHVKSNTSHTFTLASFLR